MCGHEGNYEIREKLTVSSAMTIRNFCFIAFIAFGLLTNFMLYKSDFHSSLLGISEPPLKIETADTVDATGILPPSMSREVRKIDINSPEDGKDAENVTLNFHPLGGPDAGIGQDETQTASMSAEKDFEELSKNLPVESFQSENEVNFKSDKMDPVYSSSVSADADSTESRNPRISSLRSARKQYAYLYRAMNYPGFVAEQKKKAREWMAAKVSQPAVSDTSPVSEPLAVSDTSSVSETGSPSSGFETEEYSALPAGGWNGNTGENMRNDPAFPEGPAHAQRDFLQAPLNETGETSVCPLPGTPGISGTPGTVWTETQSASDQGIVSSPLEVPSLQNENAVPPLPNAFPETNGSFENHSPETPSRRNDGADVPLPEQQPVREEDYIPPVREEDKILEQLPLINTEKWNVNQDEKKRLISWSQADECRDFPPVEEEFEESAEDGPEQKAEPGPLTFSHLEGTDLLPLLGVPELVEPAGHFGISSPMVLPEPEAENSRKKAGSEFRDFPPVSE